MQVIANGEMETDLPKIVEELMEEAEDELIKQEGLDEASNSSSSSEHIKSTDGVLPRQSTVESDDNVNKSATSAAGNMLLRKPVANRPSRVSVRVPARLEHKGRDAFVFYIEDPDDTTSLTPPAGLTPPLKLAMLATKSSADATLNDIGTVLHSVGQMPVKVSC